MKFKTPEELAERLKAGELWSLVGCKAYCLYDKEELNSYRFDNRPMWTIWEYCDGKTNWQQKVEPIEPRGNIWYITNHGGVAKGATHKPHSSFGVEFKTKEQAEQALVETRKLNRLRCFMLDIAEDIGCTWEPKYGESPNLKFSVYFVLNSNDYVVDSRDYIYDFIPICSKEVADILVKDLNSGRRIL